MACFDLQHQYLAQPRFVDSSLTASKALHSCYTGSILLLGFLLLLLWSYAPKQAWSVFAQSAFIIFFPWLLQEVVVPSLLRSEVDLNALQCCSWYCWGMFADWVLPNSTDTVGWCGRLSAHESSLSVYGPTLRPELPDGDLPHSYWQFDLMHNPEILVHITCVLLHWGYFPLNILLVFLRTTAFPVKVHHHFTVNTASAKLLIWLRYHQVSKCTMCTSYKPLSHVRGKKVCKVKVQNATCAIFRHEVWILSEKMLSVHVHLPVLPRYTLPAAVADVMALLCAIKLILRT